MRAPKACARRAIALCAAQALTGSGGAGWLGDGEAASADEGRRQLPAKRTGKSTRINHEQDGKRAWMLAILQMEEAGMRRE